MNKAELEVRAIKSMTLASSGSKTATKEEILQATADLVAYMKDAANEKSNRFLTNKKGLRMFEAAENFQAVANGAVMHDVVDPSIQKFFEPQSRNVWNTASGLGEVGFSKAVVNAAQGIAYQTNGLAGRERQQAQANDKEQGQQDISTLPEKVLEQANTLNLETDAEVRPPLLAAANEVSFFKGGGGGVMGR